MSGSLVPYHQRQNKAVDRQLFVDLLSKLNRYVAIGSYRYVGFGGAFLEDFKLIHSYFGNTNLISLEKDRIAFARQQFNMPLSCITSLMKDSADFIDEYDADEHTMIWLDYADASKTREQLQEFETLLAKLLKHDIVKITLNANPESLGRTGEMKNGGMRETVDERNVRRLQKLTHRLGDYLPYAPNANQMTSDGLPEVLIRAIELAANRAMEGRRREGLFFQPLSALVYNDSQHAMLTVTGILLCSSGKSKFFKETGIKKWKPSITCWGEYKKIMVPALTAREKVFIDQMLPKKSSRLILKKLKFQFDKSEEKSIAILDNYKLYYRYYPNFHRVAF